MPAEEVVRSRWDYVLDCIDEMTADWRLTPAPVVVDARNDTAVDPGLLRGLEDRGLYYLVRLAPGTPVHTDPATGHPVTAATLVARMGQGGSGGLTLSRRAVDGPFAAGSRFAIESLPSSAPGSVRRRPPRRLLVEWTGRDQLRTSVWLTNLTALRAPELIGLTRVRQRIAPDVAGLYDDRPSK